MATTDGPFYMRFDREPNKEYYPEDMEYKIGGSKTLRDGHQLTIMAYGRIIRQLKGLTPVMYKS